MFQRPLVLAGERISCRIRFARHPGKRAKNGVEKGQISLMKNIRFEFDWSAIMYKKRVINFVIAILARFLTSQFGNLAHKDITTLHLSKTSCIYSLDYHFMYLFSIRERLIE